MTNQTLFDIFTEFGDVSSAKISTNISGESQGCGFVEMEDQSDAKEAIKSLHGSLIEGRNIGVSQAISDHKS